MMEAHHPGQCGLRYACKVRIHPRSRFRSGRVRSIAGISNRTASAGHIEEYPAGTAYNCYKIPVSIGVCQSVDNIQNKLTQNPFELPQNFSEMSYAAKVPP